MRGSRQLPRRAAIGCCGVAIPARFSTIELTILVKNRILAVRAVPAKNFSSGVSGDCYDIVTTIENKNFYTPRERLVKAFLGKNNPASQTTEEVFHRLERIEPLFFCF